MNDGQDLLVYSFDAESLYTKGFARCIIILVLLPVLDFRQNLIFCLSFNVSFSLSLLMS